MVTKSVPSAEEVKGYMQSLSNWGRWGADDELGTLNYITPEKRIAAAKLVQKGISVGCARMIYPEQAQDLPNSPLHYMIGTGESAPEQGMGGASDFLGIAFHGYSVSHLDALSHIFWNTKSYNGLDAKLVNVSGRATKGGVQILENGVVTRGVLLDIARVRGVDWMEVGEGIFPEDLEAAEAAENVKIQPGDALLYRTGWAKAREVKGPLPVPGRPGMHAASLPWLHQRQVAIIGADAATDVGPSGYPAEDFLALPVHAVGITAMGIWILDSLSCEALAEVCIRENRWEFQFVMAPLRWRNATGSPLNPIAVF